MSDSKSVSKDSVETLEAAVADFQPSKQYPIVDEPQTLAMCGDDWNFLFELLNDIFTQNRITDIQRMEQALKNNDYEEYFQGAHSLKGVCMNLHLPGLAVVCIAADAASKLLTKYKTEHTENHPTLIANLEPYLIRIKQEFQRLEDYIPTLKLHAQQAEAAGEGEEYEDGEGEGEEEEGYDEQEEYGEQQG